MTFDNSMESQSVESGLETMTPLALQWKSGNRFAGYPRLLFVIEPKAKAATVLLQAVTASAETVWVTGDA